MGISVWRPGRGSYPALPTHVNPGTSQSHTWQVARGFSHPGPMGHCEGCTSAHHPLPDCSPSPMYLVTHGHPLTVHSIWSPGGMSVSQCSKEDGRSSSGPAHETAAPKRTYDMMEGRASRPLSSASIEGGRSCRRETQGT
jgi:hypothetical protein